MFIADEPDASNVHDWPTTSMDAGHWYGVGRRVDENSRLAPPRPAPFTLANRRMGR
jgi:hypothetical protein